MTFITLLILFKIAKAAELDPMGYLIYCPCMGRFGNQADHFLGSLAFSKALNRTLVLPPWVEYKKKKLKSIQTPFNEYFEVEPLQHYHRVILMEDFMYNISNKVWPVAERVSFCYQERKPLNTENTKKDCYAKDGNPFGPFWDTYNIEFVHSEFFSPLHFDVYHSDIAQKWKAKYPPEKWPVLAFTGSPASFPVQLKNRELQKYLVWSKKKRDIGLQFIRTVLPKGAFIGIHLRNGIDWVRACEHIKNSKQLFASPQCLGYSNEKGDLHLDLCMPTKELIIKQLKRLIKNVKLTHKNNEVRSVFVASDSNHMIPEINQALARMNVTAYKIPIDDPHLDLIILGVSNHFVGNCISSFSAFVKRERDVSGLPSYFWGFPKEKERQHSRVHEEL